MLLFTTLTTLILPESFASTARIRVEHDQSDVPGLGEHPTAVSFDPYFVQTEFEVLRSEAVLDPVISKLRLNQTWAPKYLGQQGGLLKTEETRRFLRASLVLNTVRNTSIIEITCYSDKPEEAKDLANAIAETYREYRNARRTAMIQESIKALERVYADNLQQIQSLQAELASRPQAANLQETNRWSAAEQKVQDLQQFDKVLSAKIAGVKTDLYLPAANMVQVVEHAVVSAKPVRPNKPLNIAVGLLFGGLAGVFLATFVYLLQLRAYRRSQATVRMGFPPRFRAVVHVLIALIVGMVLGYLIGCPWDWATIAGIPLVLFVGVGASAYLELAQLRPEPAGPSGASVALAATAAGVPATSGTTATP